MKIAFGLLFPCLLFQGEGPKKFAPTVPDLLKDGFLRMNAGLSQAAVLPDNGQYSTYNGDPTRLPAVTRAMSKPLEMPLMTLEVLEGVETSRRSMEGMLRAVYHWSGEAAPEKEPPSEPAGEDAEAFVQAFADLEIDTGRIPDDAFREQVAKQASSLPKGLLRPIADLLAAMRRAAARFAEEKESLGEGGRKHLETHGPEFNHPDKEEREADQVETSKIYWEQFRSPALLEAALGVARAVDGIAAAAAAPPAKGPAVIFERESPLGRVLIGGVGKNAYETDAALILDLGGDDLYKNNAGGSAALPSGIAVCIDLAGNDRYESKKEGVQGCGLLGIGFLLDLKGDDVYLAGNLSQGCGQLGFGLLVDRAGSDKYEAGGLAQGSGQFGLGVLEDEAGDDEYKATLYAQGFGGPGGVGALVERKGKDRYFAGGKYPDTIRDKTKFLSLSQGFGYGSRLGRVENDAFVMTGSIPGGVGILADVTGDDVYESQVFGQGSSYWFSLGMLVDQAGNDSYKSWRYAQGAGAHVTAGILVDLWGNDSYTAWGVSQGCAHDHAAAILLDYIGNDVYKAETLSQGVANARGSFGLLIDREGTDSYSYAGKDKNCWGAVAMGEFKAEDKPRSYGFFLDLAGKDQYKGPRALKDGVELQDENFGLGFAGDR